MIDNRKLSKQVSYILRHNPYKFNLNLDEKGFCLINDLIDVLNQSKKFINTNIDISVLHNMLDKIDKQRFEIKDDKIRALYGHSIKLTAKLEPKEPPEYLYHGTSQKAFESIKTKGLISMSRQYVHLSTNTKTALIVGSRRDKNPIILRINSLNAYHDEIDFYHGNKDVWLAKEIPFKYIEKI